MTDYDHNIHSAQGVIEYTRMCMQDLCPMPVTSEEVKTAIKKVMDQLDHLNLPNPTHEILVSSLGRIEVAYRLGGFGFSQYLRVKES